MSRASTRMPVFGWLPWGSVPCKGATCWMWMHCDWAWVHPAIVGFGLSSFIQQDDGPPAKEEEVGKSRVSPIDQTVAQAMP